MANVLQWNSSTNSFSVSGASSVTQVVGEGIDNNFSVPQTFGAGILQTGAAGAGNQSPLLNVGDAFSDFIASGVQWGVPSPASLTTGMSSGVAYINGTRTLVPEVTGNPFPASNDTYVSFNNSGVPAYQSVANGATAPTPESGYVQTAKVVTSPIQSPTATLSTSTSGSLASGTYGIALVAFDATGYGAVGASGTVAVTSAQSGSGSIEISWVNPLNETSMDIYATTAGSTTLGLVASGVTGTSYTYTGATVPGAAAPTTATSNAIQKVDNVISSQSTVQQGLQLVVISGNTILTSADSNKLIGYNGTSNGTVILPDATSEPNGSMIFTFSNLSSYILTISVEQNNLIDTNRTALLPRQQAAFVNAGIIWRAISQSDGIPNIVLQSTSPIELSGASGTGHSSKLNIVPYTNGSSLVIGPVVACRDITINGFSVNGIEINGGGFLSQIYCYSANMDSTGVGNNLYLNGAVQGLVLSDSELVGGANGMEVTPLSTTLPVRGFQNGPAFNRYTNVFFDSSTNGALIDWSMDSIFTACWFSNRPGNGATVGTNFASGINFIGSTFENCGSHGLAIEAGAVNTSIVGCLIKGNNTEKNGSYGIYVANNTKGFTISNNTITSLLGGSDSQVAAIYIGTGCDDYIIEGNYLLGNTSTIIDNSATTATNRIVRNNIGYNDDIIAINSTQTLPNYIFNNKVKVNGTYTITLPVDNGNAGDVIHFFASDNNLPYTIVSNSGQFIYSPPIGLASNTGPTTLNCAYGNSCILMSRGTGEFDIIGGTILLSQNTAPAFLNPITSPAAASTGQLINLGQANSLYQSSKLVLSSTTTSGSITATAAQLVGGYLADGATQTAAFTVTTDTAANILAQMPNAAVGTSFKFRFINNDQSSTGYAGTLAGGTGVTVGTVLPNPAVPKGGYEDYVFTFTAIGSTPTLTVEAVGGNSASLL